MDFSSCTLNISLEESMRDSIKHSAKKKKKNPHLLAFQLVEGSYFKTELTWLSRTNLMANTCESMLPMTNDCSVSQVVFNNSLKNFFQNFTRD